MELNNSTLHHAIIDTFLKRGWAPSAAELAERFGVARARVSAALQELQEYHGVVLHPGTDDIWVAHPFSNAPTSFLVRTQNMEWWGNCAWCSLGLAILAGGTAEIVTTLGTSMRQVTIRIENGKVLDKDLFIHFPIPMARAWDNVTFTCSMMLLFECEADVDVWCATHGKSKGDVRPIEQVLNFASDWYGNHSDQNWVKWTGEEAAQIFSRHGLSGPIWDLGNAKDRF